MKLLLWLLCVPISGCYYLQAAQGQLALTLRRQPIAELRAAAQTPPALRQQLAEVQRIRRFASEVLALPDNASYTTFVQLRQPYVVWNVFAAPALSLQPVRWCFPVAGCVVYRGYFTERAAQRMALRLRSRGLDASVSGVTAYSTLGHFHDPILSSMLSAGSVALAETVFHELAHQVAYAPGDTAFNEAFATTVAEVGLQRWLESEQRSAAWQRWQLGQRRQQQVAALLRQTRADLGALYASPAAPQDKQMAKQQRLGQLKFEYRQLKQQWQQQGMATDGYDGWFERRLSNADFIAVAAYQDCVPAFQALLTRVDGDLPAFYAEVQHLVAASAATRRRFCTTAAVPSSVRQDMPPAPWGTFRLAAQS